jgi:predicted AAA+ superfamily ATPase
VIDEIQREPNLVLPIKARVDDSDRPGQFLLTGSARLLGLRSLPDSLVGRSETIELWPFSQGELAGCVETFLDSAFSQLPLPKGMSPFSKKCLSSRGFVIGELMRQATWSETILRTYHCRDRDNREIDLVLESSDGTLVGAEVKAGMTVRAEDFRHLTFLRNALGDRFRHGLVFYSGADTLHFGDRLTALPISSLRANDREVT